MNSLILEFGCKKRFRSQIINRMANRVDSEETARYDPSHLDLHCLHISILVYSAEKIRVHIFNLLIRQRHRTDHFIL